MLKRRASDQLHPGCSAVPPSVGNPNALVGHGCEGTVMARVVLARDFGFIGLAAAGLYSTL